MRSGLVSRSSHENASGSDFTNQYRRSPSARGAKTAAKAGAGGFFTVAFFAAGGFAAGGFAAGVFADGLRAGAFATVLCVADFFVVRFFAVAPEERCRAE